MTNDKRIETGVGKCDNHRQGHDRSQVSMDAFTVKIHFDLENELDECFSPGDGIAAIGQLHGELPRLHRSRTKRRSRGVKRIHLYRGRYAWFDLGFSYVQVGNVLYVIEIWHDDDWNNPNRQEVDVVLSDSEETWTRPVQP